MFRKRRKKWNKNTQHIHHQSIQTMFTSWRKKHPNNWHHNIIAGHRQTNQVESWLQSSMTQHLTQKPSTKTQINQSLSEFGLWHSNYQDANYSAVFFSMTRDTKETEERKNNQHTNRNSDLSIELKKHTSFCDTIPLSMWTPHEIICLAHFVKFFSFIWFFSFQMYRRWAFQEWFIEVFTVQHVSALIWMQWMKCKF